jgi:hypothetical protein
MYDVDEDVLSMFQRATKVVDPPRIPTSRRCGGDGEDILQGFT